MEFKSSLSRFAISILLITVFTGLTIGNYTVAEQIQPEYIMLGNQDANSVVPSEEQLTHVKWSQPPVEFGPNPEVEPTFCGWNEPARSTEQSGQSRQWRMDADDFHCLGAMPVTRIRWWGGYKAWTKLDLPESQPEIWHITFWANQVENVPREDLYPERPVWLLKIPAERINFEPVGLNEFPQKQPSEMCFVYEVNLEPEEWFYQGDFESNENVFWISITAVYPTDSKQINMWGWLTRPHIWCNGAVNPAIMGDWPTYDECLFPGRIYPIENSLLCGQSRCYDMCFELLTEQSWIKWDQPFTGIREWSNYSGYQSMALESEENELLISRRVADDWHCENDGPVTAIAWNGSYIGYTHEACKCDEIQEPRSPDYFLLSIWNNAPGNDTELENRPGEKTWEYSAYDYDEIMVGYNRNPEGEPNEPVFRYCVSLPEEAWFRQENPDQLYWFSVIEVFKEALGEIPYQWGWTNHSSLSGNSAQARDDNPDADSQWQLLLDATDQPFDMSFTFFTKPEP